jgi:NodT family efflux transporter outer membrane factor (OMF) lipoprotein
MSRRLILIAAATASSAAVLSACTVGPNYAPPTLESAPGFRNAPAAAARTAPVPSPAARWWEAFNDPVLNDLEARALAQNLDLAQAAARVQQARAAAGFAKAARLPAGELNAQAARAYQSLEGAGGQAAAYERTADLFDLNPGAAWELDLFGQLRRQDEAARADLAAADAGLNAARVMVAGDVADAYLLLRALQTRLAVAQRLAARDAELVEIVRLQFESGAAPRLRLDQAQAQRAQIEAQIPALSAAVEGQLNRLAVLTGRAPEAERTALAAPAPIPAAPGVPATLTPADLIARRPDVAAAEHRLAAANARIGAAVADYYPKVSLQGLFGLESLDAGRLFTGGAFQAQGAAGLRWRLFDFGRVDAAVLNAKGVQAERLAAYRAVVLRAAEEMENALSALVERERQAARLGEAAAALERARDAAQAAYEAGAVSLIEVIDADRQLFAASDARASAQGEAARAAVGVFRAAAL